MSAPEITPELLRRIINHPDAPHDTLMGLKAWAARMEREQAAEKRIEELVSTFWSAYSSGEHIDDVATSTKSDLRTGIRAVLAKLDDEREPKFDKGGLIVAPVRQWDDLRHVPADVLAVCTTEGDAHRDSTTHNGWRWINSTPVSEYSLTAFKPYTEIVGGDR